MYAPAVPCHSISKRATATDYRSLREQQLEYGDVGVPVQVLEAARSGRYRAEHRVRLPARPNHRIA